MTSDMSLCYSFPLFLQHKKDAATPTEINKQKSCSQYGAQDEWVDAFCWRGCSPCVGVARSLRSFSNDPLDLFLLRINFFHS